MSEISTILLTNAKIFTFSDDQPVVNFLLIQDGKILDIGQSAQVKSQNFKNIKIVDLNNYIVLPGLIDSHIHLEQYAFSLQKVNCEVPTLKECLSNIKASANQTDVGSWILGHGWNQNNWHGGFPNATMLDQISTTNPMFLTAKSLHAAWVNHKTLQLANITSTTPDPPGGSIQRYANGEPTGILFETAMELVIRHIPELTVEEAALAIKKAQPKLWQFGITGVHDFDRGRCFSALQLLHENGDLNLRVIKNMPVEMLDKLIEIGLRSGFGNDWLKIGSIKAFADGALGPRTAAMFQPYDRDPENSGILMLDQEYLVEIGRKATANGFSMAVHAIGDRANHEVLNAFQQIRDFEHHKKLPTRRHRMEHVQLIHPQDRDRLAKYGVIASMQPIHAISDKEMADQYWGTRSIGAYAWKYQLDAGAMLAFGSDAPVDSPNPFWGLHAAVCRQRKGETDIWYPAQKLSLSDSLKAYTIGAAYTAGLENKQGKLLPGYFADLIVLPKNPFEIPADEIFDLFPVKTMISGNWVYNFEG